MIPRKELEPTQCIYVEIDEDGKDVLTGYDPKIGIHKYKLVSGGFAELISQTNKKAYHLAKTYHNCDMKKELKTVLEKRGVENINDLSDEIIDILHKHEILPKP